MFARRSSFALLFVVAAAGATASLVNCAAPESPDAAEPTLSEDAVTGVNNPLGLALRYDEESGRVQATLGAPLKDGEKLLINVRRGKLTLSSQKELKCQDLVKATPITNGGARDLTGKVVYQGPKVDKAIIDLLRLYDDPRWATGDVSQGQLDEVKRGPDPIVEACIVKGDAIRAKLQTGLALAWDQATADKKLAGTVSASLRLRAEDGGLEGEDAGAPDATAPTEVDAGAPGADAGAEPRRLTEADDIESQISYGEVCVNELGEIPFFPKLGDGKYGTFDCRDLVAQAGEGATPQKVTGVEGAGIPITSSRTPITKCDPGRELGPGSGASYDCVDKCDEGMYLSPGACQPGPMVVTAKNAQGTHWVLLCRKVEDDGRGMMKTKHFNDIAMIGHNPKTGRTCFFQNAISSGTDGEHVTHPADREKSTHIWSSHVQSYCSGSCHATDPFVHSKWIDGAKRGNGTPIIPMMGRHPDFAVSYLESPYNIVAADKLGFEIPKQLVSEEVGPCANCHRLGGNTAGDFARWATGEGESYFSKITDFGKKFEEAHWMPLRLDGLTAENFKTSKYGKALEHMRKCESSPSDPACEWKDVPRGRFNNPAVTP